MRTLFAILGTLCILIGAFALLGSSTAVGQIGGLVLWVIAAQLLGASAIIEAIQRKA